MFDLGPSDEIEMCQVAGVDAVGNSHVITRYVDTSVCVSDDGGYTDDGTVDDSSGDDSGDDGSTDDGSTDDGSSDDGSSDSGDGGDDGSTDRRVPTTQTPERAPISDMAVTRGL
jgi:hypothetical protein